MKKKIIIITLLIISCVFSGCKNDEEDLEMPYWLIVNQYLPIMQELKCPPKSYDVSSKVYSIEGRWKLFMDINGGDAIDYSCNSISYLFKNGILTVESDVKGIPEGEFKYIYYPFHNPSPETSLPPQEGFSSHYVINDEIFRCQAAGVFLYIFTFGGGGEVQIEKIFCKI